MKKLLVRGLIEKCKGANYYRFTKNGYIWINITNFQNMYFLTPLLSMTIEKEISQKSEGLDVFELTLTILEMD